MESIPDGVQRRQHPGGLELLEISNAQASAELALQGGQLLQWTPQGQRPVVWLSPAAKLLPGKAVRGGVPVCWPWFGAHQQHPGFPAHGYARTALWELTEIRQSSDGATCLALRLQAGPASPEWWPYDSSLELHIRVGTALELELVTRNNGNATFRFSAALHSYFAVSDVRQASIGGLDGCSYLDKTDGNRPCRQSGPVAIAGEVDRVYLNSSADCLIHDPAWQRHIRVEKRGSQSTVVWNPWRDKAAQLGDLGEDGYLRMLCLESANVADDSITLPPGGEHRLWVRYSIQPDA